MSKMWTLGAALAAVITGCSGKSAEDSGQTSEAQAAITGTVTADGEASAQIAFYKAFGFDQGGQLLAYFASSPTATCANVTEYLRVTGGVYDPVDMFQDGHCNMFVILDKDYEGTFSFTRPSGSEEPNLVAAGTSIECAMGEGSFELTRLTEIDDDDYYWTGRWWVGRPSAYTYNFTGGAGSAYSFTLEMSEYEGGFIHEGLDSTPATGAVSGTIEGEWCPDLGSTGFF